MIRNRFCKALVVFALAGVPVGCTGVMPVPGGSETVNESFYQSEEDLLAHLNTLEKGMPQQEVFMRLGRSEDDLIRLSREEVVKALFGDHQADIGGDLVQSLYGYRLNYKVVKRKHGFSSPIRIRTDEKGFDYSVSLIFREGVLYEKPLVSGGMERGASSHTIFDYVTPGTLLDHTAR